ncbi:MAG TPA: hypothetical protein PLU16_12150 [Gallionellaceae bacterium]|nr:hypothetical protein [Gallionellaceae bacterium]HQS75958.1 hypothetical protein [Gallionellaceae bacterium]
MPHHPCIGLTGIPQHIVQRGINTIRVNRVQGHGLYRWSSYRHNGLGQTDTRITPHPVYWALTGIKLIDRRPTETNFDTSSMMMH